MGRGLLGRGSLGRGSLGRGSGLAFCLFLLLGGIVVGPYGSIRKTPRRWRTGRRAASRWTPACASTAPTARAWNGCCATAPRRCCEAAPRKYSWGALARPLRRVLARVRAGSCGLRGFPRAPGFGCFHSLRAIFLSGLAVRWRPKSTSSSNSPITNQQLIGGPIKRLIRSIGRRWKPQRRPASSKMLDLWLIGRQAGRLRPSAAVAAPKNRAARTAGN